MLKKSYELPVGSIMEIPSVSLTCPHCGNIGMIAIQARKKAIQDDGATVYEVLAICGPYPEDRPCLCLIEHIEKYPFVVLYDNGHKNN